MGGTQVGVYHVAQLSHNHTSRHVTSFTAGQKYNKNIKLLLKLVDCNIFMINLLKIYYMEHLIKTII